MAQYRLNRPSSLRLMSLAQPLDVTRPRPDIAVLTLNRPDKLNALSYELVEALHAALDDIAADNDCRVVVLTGAGRGFCSGLDLSAPNPPEAAGGTEFPRSGMRWQERIANLTAKLHRLRQPVIAAVNGPAYGGGFALAAASDIRLAAESARFCTQFIKLGIGGCDIGVSYTLPRIIGAGPAFDLILTARAVDATEALRLGLVSRVCADVTAEAMDIAETLCGYGKFGVESTKQVLWANLDAGCLEAALHVENRSQILASTEGGVRAFSEEFRRRPR
ncbi:Enoyl-CoA hydratase/isomerase [Mycolicibacterium smegmatis MC2 155]|uniref:Enoyl-CoA hydratase/isomerase n=4 Tax=Bacteria TaxID=2 RepID=I7FYQ5_MYCS2|nr:Enoyl-CoA hydratase/isomerase [Mycolicibacterium smegmatis MC2 155]STZ32878.1 enoyl-CoA hydratase/isomerase [Mycolicibacterium smegmatis]VTP10160.1 4-chlorobenzoyl coenzyme A dehalogenase [Mycolicibacterium smegmatis]